MPGLVGLALEGAREAARTEPAGWRRWRKRAVLIARVAGLQLADLVGTSAYGARALCVHRGLWRGRRGRTWSLVKGCPYGSDARQFVDVYVPSGSSPAQVSGEPHNGVKAHPVAVFCHGGAWAAGEAWHYSCLGASLAAEGVLAVVPAYRLYPKANPGEQAGDLGKALSWAMDNAARFGGDSSNLTLIGHSSGAHLCALEMLRRAEVPLGAVLDEAMNIAGREDRRQPRRFVGIAGPYDTERHFHHEAGRGVESLSPMARSMAPSGMGAFSPARALREYIGELTPEQFPSEGPTLVGDAHAWVASVGCGVAGGASSAPASLEESLPQCFVVTGLMDQSVPWPWGADFHRLLRLSGARSRNLLYREWGHNDFITDWGRGLDDKSPYVRDTISIALGVV